MALIDSIPNVFVCCGGYTWMGQSNTPLSSTFINRHFSCPHLRFLSSRQEKYIFQEQPVFKLAGFKICPRFLGANCSLLFVSIFLSCCSQESSTYQCPFDTNLLPHKCKKLPKSHKKVERIIHEPTSLSPQLIFLVQTLHAWKMPMVYQSWLADFVWFSCRQKLRRFSFYANMLFRNIYFITSFEMCYRKPWGKSYSCMINHSSLSVSQNDCIFRYGFASKADIRPIFAS